MKYFLAAKWMRLESQTPPDPPMKSPKLIGPDGIIGFQEQLLRRTYLLRLNFPFILPRDRQGTFLEATVGESAYANYEPDANTVGLWHLEEQTGSGAYIKDSSSNGNNGTPTGTTNVVGKLGKARSFNGGSDYVNLDAYASSIPSGASNITVEAWAKWNVTPTGNSVVVSYGGNNLDKGFLLHYENSTSKLDFNVIGVGNAQSFITPTANQWYHLQERTIIHR